MSNWKEFLENQNKVARSYDNMVPVDRNVEDQQSLQRESISGAGSLRDLRGSSSWRLDRSNLKRR